MSSSTANSKSVVTLIAFGTALWMMAGIYLAITGAESRVIATCISGTALGLWGVRYTKRRAARSGI